MSEPRVYVYVHNAYTDMICFPQTVNVWQSFERCGAIVLYGDSFRSALPGPDDKLVCYGRVDEHKDIAARFARENRWHYVVDEASSTSEPYDKAMAYMRMIGIPNIIVTYQNAGHLKKLRDNGFKYIIMPQTMPAIRPKVEKVHDVLCSGQMHDGFYPVRTKVTAALLAGIPQHVHNVPTPGQDISTRRHNIIRDEYYDLLDRCRMGVVCRAGNRDRFVAKYIEMGACNVLPIGDCPTYMPDEMKSAMVNVEGMRGEEAVAEVTRLLNERDELQARTDAYVSATQKHYMSIPNMQRVMGELLCR